VGCKGGEILDRVHGMGVADGMLKEQVSPIQSDILSIFPLESGLV
jgi:hypothetical protein